MAERRKKEKKETKWFNDLTNQQTYDNKRPAIAVTMVCVLLLLGVTSLGKTTQVDQISAVTPTTIVKDTGAVEPSDVFNTPLDPYADPNDKPEDFSPIGEPVSEYAPGTLNRTWESNTNYQFIYLIGVEGAGHHGVAVLLARMAQFADMAFHMRNRDVRKSIFAQNSAKFKRAFSKGVKSNPKVKHVFLEDNSFPSLHYKRHSKFSSIKKDHRYDLEWIVDTAMDAEADVKLLLLTRTFLNQVWSHKKWDGGFTGHAKTLAHYMEYLDLEINRINKDELWTRIDYNWFSDEVCPIIVPKLADFLQWPSPRDPVKFCSQTPFHLSTKHPELDEEETKFLEDLLVEYKDKWGVYTNPEKSLLSEEELPAKNV